MPNRSPLNQYQALVSSNQISFDASQQQAVELLQQLYLMLKSENVNKNSKDRVTVKAIKGVYLWGKVGRGKTFLMDLFVNSLARNYTSNRRT